MENNPRLQALLASAVNIRDVISDATEHKEPGIAEIIDPIGLKNGDFVEKSNDKENDEPYDAEANARSLVYGLHAIDTTVFTIVGSVKVKKQVGGKETLKQMKEAYQKNASGEKLTEKEEKLLASFAAYKADMSMLSEDFIPNQKKTEELIKAAIPYCEATKFKMGPGVAFWSVYTGQLVEKVAKLILK